MPTYRELTYNKMSVPEMVKIAQSMKDPTAQVETLRILKEDRKWTPLTNDMVHISFGAILGVAALPQNRRRNMSRYESDEGDDNEQDNNDDDDNNDDSDNDDRYDNRRRRYGSSGSSKKSDEPSIPSDSDPDKADSDDGDNK